jgi:hypothetical protein
MAFSPRWASAMPATIAKLMGCCCRSGIPLRREGTAAASALFH